MTMDYSSFTLQQPLPEAVVTWQNGPTSSFGSDNDARKPDKLDERFISSMEMYIGLTDDVVIISHPHGSQKQVSVGKFTEKFKDRIPTYTAPTCPGSSGAPLLTLGRVPLQDGLNSLDIPGVYAGRCLHQGDHTTDQGTVTGVGATPSCIPVPYGDPQDGGIGWFGDIANLLGQCMLTLLGIVCFYGLFCVVGPPWTQAAFVLFLAITVYRLVTIGASGFRVSVNIVLSMSVSFAVMHGVTELACVLAPPEDRGWLWTALLMLSCDLTCLVVHSPPVSKLLVSGMRSFWWLCAPDQSEAGARVQCILTLLNFVCLYGLFCVVGPPWTLPAFFFLAITVSGLEMFGERGLCYAVMVALRLSLDLAAMQGVTELAYVLVPPDDRGWLWTALLTMSSFLIHLVVCFLRRTLSCAFFP